MALLVLLALGSCQNEIVLDLPVAADQLVVEGSLKQGPGPHRIMLSTTTAYYEGGKAVPVVDATVTIEDNTGNRQVLSHERPGEYLCTLEGVVGRTYTLRINYHGREYQAQGTLHTPVLPQTIAARPLPQGQPGLTVDLIGPFAQVTPAYYRLCVWRNDSLLARREHYRVFASANMPADAPGIPSDIVFRPGDRARLQVDRIDEPMYNYYQGLVKLLFNDGGLFSPPPTNPPTNIVNLTQPNEPPLGYFQVSAHSAIEDVVMP